MMLHIFREMNDMQVTICNLLHQFIHKGFCHMFRPQHMVSFKERNIAERPHVLTDNIVIRERENIS